MAHGFQMAMLGVLAAGAFCACEISDIGNSDGGAGHHHPNVNVDESCGCDGGCVAATLVSDGKGAQGSDSCERLEAMHTCGGNPEGVWRFVELCLKKHLQDYMGSEFFDADEDEDDYEDDDYEDEDCRVNAKGSLNVGDYLQISGSDYYLKFNSRLTGKLETSEECLNMSCNSYGAFDDNMSCSGSSDRCVCEVNALEDSFESGKITYDSKVANLYFDVKHSTTENDIDVSTGETFTLGDQGLFCVENDKLYIWTAEGDFVLTRDESRTFIR